MPIPQSLAWASTNPDDAQRCREAASAANREAKQQGKDRCVVVTLS
jgi:hypothetical protein